MIFKTDSYFCGLKELFVMTSVLQSDVPVINLADSLRYSTERIIGALHENPSGFFSDLGHDALIFGMKVVAALVIYFIGIFLIRWIRKLMRRSFDRKKTDPTVSTFVSSLVSITLTLLLIVITIGTLGVNTTSLAAVLAAGGLSVGMAMSGTMQNFAGGLMIMVFKPFKVGDYIQVMGVAGTVMEMTMVNTKLRTFDNRIIYVPNGKLFDNTIENVTVQNIRRVDWVVSVEYGSDADACIELLLRLINSDPRVLNSTTEGAADPVAVLSSMNENDISFSVKAWANTSDYWDLLYDMNLKFYDELPKAGFSFAYPHMDVTIDNNLKNKLK